MPIWPPQVYVKDTGTAMGRGVFAARAHARGELVELCPVILFHGKATSVPGEVRRLLFNWGVLADLRNTHCLALGYGSLYNHQNPASMRYEADITTPALRFIAVRDILQDEELTINYNALGGAAESLDDTWFRGQRVDLLVGPTQP
jgi:hypothetical protein